MNKAELNNYIPHPFTILIFIYGCCIYYTMGLPMLFDPDTPWHIAAGDIILTQKSIPPFDPWSYTAGEHRWYNLSWLWDVFISYIAKICSIHGLYVAMVLLYSGLLALVFSLLIKRQPISVSAAALATIFLSFVLLEFFSARPHFITFLFTVITYHCLHKSLTENTKHIYILPLISLLWANMHGGFLILYVLIAIYGILTLTKKSWEKTIKITTIGLLCLIANIVTPLDIHILDATLRSLDSTITAHINEWRYFVPGRRIGLTIFFVVTILLIRFKKRDIPLMDIITTLIWAVAGILSIRHFPIFALIGTYYIAYQLQYTGYMRNITTNLNNKSRSAIFLLALTIIALMVFKTIKPSLFYADDKKATSRISANALDHILTHHKNTRFLNNYEIGSYIIYYTKGEIPVFIDGRAGTAYPENILENYLNMQNAGSYENLKPYLKQYNINGIVTSKRHPLHGYMKEKTAQKYWKKTFEDDTTATFIKISH